MTNLKVKKTLYFTDIQIQLGNQKAASIGMSFSEWVKYVVMKELESFSGLAILDHQLESEDRLEYNEGKEYLAKAGEIQEDDFDDNALPY